MHSRWLVLTSTAFEVLGTFCLAVEAIKLQNLRFFRERVLKVAALRVNPIIHFVDKETPETKAVEIWMNLTMVFFTTLGLICFYVFLRFTGHSLVETWRAFSKFVPGPIWVDVIALLPTIFVVIILASVMGTTVYTVIVVLVNGAIVVLSFVERNTASGVIGILGFMLFVIGAAIAAFVAWQRA